MAQFGAGVGGAVKLDGLTDVNVGASPANSSVLVYSTATDTWGAGTVVSGSTIALNGLTDVTGTSTQGLPLVRQSSAYGFAALGSGGIADGAVATSKLPAKAVTLAKISAGDSTTSGHVLTVSGSTGDVTAAALPDIDIEAVFGITASPEAGNVIKRNTANTAWVYAADATGGGGGGGSGIALTDLSASGIVDFDNTTGAFSTDTAELADAIDGILEDSGSITITKSGNTITLSVPDIPSKAGASELREGVDDTKFVTPAGVASMDQTAAAGVTWSFTYDTTGALAQGQVRENATAYQYTIKATNSVETDMDQRFHRGAKIRLERDASNYVRGRVQWADKGEGDQGDEFTVQVAAEDRAVAGDIKVDGAAVSVYAEGALWPGLHDDGEFVVYDDITAGTGITKGARQADGTFTISASGAIAKADKPTALAGTDDTKFMTPLRVHDVVDHLGHVADYTGMQYTTSQAGEMAVGTWNINASGTRAWFRGHTQAQAEEMAREFLIDRYFILGRNGQTIEAQFTDVTSIAVSGSSVGVVQCDIQDHDANPDNPTLAVGDDWDLALLSPQAMALFRHIPHAVITGNSIKTGAVGVAQLRGQVQECRMFMDNDSGSRNQNITDSASTDFGTGTLTTVSANVKSWAIGGGTNTGEHFDQRDGFTLLGNASPDFCEFRAESDGVYSVQMDGNGVFYMQAANSATPRSVGLEVGLQFAEKAPGSSDWSAWAHCGNTDISRTIDGASTLVYDESAFYGNSTFLSGQNKSVFRTKAPSRAPQTAPTFSAMSGRRSLRRSSWAAPGRPSPSATATIGSGSCSTPRNSTTTRRAMCGYSAYTTTPSGWWRAAGSRED